MFHNLSLVSFCFFFFFGCAAPEAQGDRGVGGVFDADIVTDTDAAIDTDADPGTDIGLDTDTDTDAVLDTETDTDTDTVTADTGVETDVDTGADCVDGDGDGHCTDVDCADANPDVYPGAIEVCGDGLDNNCDGVDDECVDECVGCLAVEVEMDPVWCRPQWQQVRFSIGVPGDDFYVDGGPALSFTSEYLSLGHVPLPRDSIVAVQVFCDSNGDGDPLDDEETWGSEFGPTGLLTHVVGFVVDGVDYTSSLRRYELPALGELTFPYGTDLHHLIFVTPP